MSCFLCARSSVDRAPASGAGCVGSIPVGRAITTKAADIICGFYYIVLYSFIEQTNSEQIFLISHNNLFESEPIDLIMTGNVDIDSFKQSNIIFRP